MVNGDIINSNSNVDNNNLTNIGINSNKEILNVGNSGNVKPNSVVSVNGQVQQQQNIGLSGLLGQIETLLDTILNQVLRINVIPSALARLLVSLLTQVTNLLQNLLNSLLNTNQNSLIGQITDLIAQSNNIIGLINQRSVSLGLFGQIFSPLSNIFLGGNLQLGLVPSLLLQVINILANLL